MKKTSNILCFILLAICLVGVFHIKHLQKLEAAKQEKKAAPLQHESQINSTFERAENGKKNIINILILIIKKSNI